ncbi:MAG TPA: hypothetical protein VI033_03570 [Candidatus Nitrosopolaris sp.]
MTFTVKDTLPPKKRKEEFTSSPGPAAYTVRKVPAEKPIVSTYDPETGVPLQQDITHDDLESKPFVPRRNRLTKPFAKSITSETELEDIAKRDDEVFRGSSQQALYHDMIRHQQEMKEEEEQRSHMPNTNNELSHESDIEKDRIHERRRKGLD